MMMKNLVKDVSDLYGCNEEVVEESLLNDVGVTVSDLEEFWKYMVEEGVSTTDNIRRDHPKHTLLSEIQMKMNIHLLQTQLKFGGVF